MGWCHEFGAQVRDGCDHAMVAGSASCHCPECGFECTGKFAGCSVVWAAGPRDVAPRRREDRPIGRRSTRAGVTTEEVADEAAAEVTDEPLVRAGGRRGLNAVGRRGQPDRSGRRARRPDGAPAGPWAGPAASAEMDLSPGRSGVAASHAPAGGAAMDLSPAVAGAGSRPAGPPAGAEADPISSRSGAVPSDPPGTEAAGRPTGSGPSSVAATARRAGLATPGDPRPSTAGDRAAPSRAHAVPATSSTPSPAGADQADGSERQDPGPAPVVETPGSSRPASTTPVGTHQRYPDAAGSAEPAEVGPVQSSADGRQEVLDWLRVAFDGVRLDLRSLRDGMRDSQAEIAAMREAGRAAARLVELVDELPERVGDAVGEVLKGEHEKLLAAVESRVAGPRPLAAPDGPTELGPVPLAPTPTPAELGPVPLAPTPTPALDRARTPAPAPAAERPRIAERPVMPATPAAAMTETLREALAEVHTAASDLRNEMTRLAAFREALADDLPSVADAVDRASERANGRLQDLASRVETLAEQPGWELAIDQLRRQLPEVTSGVAGVEGPRAS